MPGLFFLSNPEIHNPVGDKQYCDHKQYISGKCKNKRQKYEYERESKRLFDDACIEFVEWRGKMPAPADQIRFDIFGVRKEFSGEKIVISTVFFDFDAIKRTFGFWATGFDFSALSDPKRLLNGVCNRSRLPPRSNLSVCIHRNYQRRGKSDQKNQGS